MGWKMSQKTDAVMAETGISMAAGPAMVDKPFYESFTWLAVVAALGIFVLSVSAINGVMTLRDNIKKRRNSEDG